MSLNDCTVFSDKTPSICTRGCGSQEGWEKKTEGNYVQGMWNCKCFDPEVSLTFLSLALFYFIFLKLLFHSITLTSQRRKNRRSCLHVPGIDFCMSHLLHLKISGKSDSRQRRHALKEVIFFFVVVFLFYFLVKICTFLPYLQYYSIQGGRSNIMSTETQCSF